MEDENSNYDKGVVLSPLFDAERTLAYLLGLHAYWLAESTPMQEPEREAKEWLNASFLQGGLQILQPPNPYEEEKGEARSATSTPGILMYFIDVQILYKADVFHTFNSTVGNTPTEEPKHQIRGLRRCRSDSITPFLQAVAEYRISDPQVNALFTLIDRYCKQQHLMAHVDFSMEHPVEEVGRVITAVLIKHLYLGNVVLSLVESEMKKEYPRELPKQFCDVIKTVHNAKWNLIKIRQEKNCSYKEVATPMLDRCRFLLYEVRAATSHEISALKRLQLLYTVPLWKKSIKKLISDIRDRKSMISSKPEDIVNASIQSQRGGEVRKKCKAQDAEGMLL